MKRIIRVFPARTHATPDDDLVRINAIPSLFDEADEVHISVALHGTSNGRNGQRNNGLALRR